MNGKLEALLELVKLLVPPAFSTIGFQNGLQGVLENDNDLFVKGCTVFFMGLAAFFAVYMHSDYRIGKLEKKNKQLKSELLEERIKNLSDDFSKDFYKKRY
jgi:hypothetical protein